VESEWKKMPRDYSAADIDKNGKITPLELARAMAKRKPETAVIRKQGEEG